MSKVIPVTEIMDLLADLAHPELGTDVALRRFVHKHLPGISTEWEKEILYRIEERLHIPMVNLSDHSLALLHEILNKRGWLSMDYRDCKGETDDQ